MLLSERVGTGERNAPGELDDSGGLAPWRRVPRFYRVPEFEGVAPSARGNVLRQALAWTDRGWPMVRQIAFGLLCAVCVVLLLQLNATSSVVTALATSAVFVLAFLLTRRDNVRRFVRRRLSSRRG